MTQEDNIIPWPALKLSEFFIHPITLIITFKDHVPSEEKRNQILLRIRLMTMRKVDIRMYF